MDKIEKIRAEIERRLNILTNVYAEQVERKDEEMMNYYHGKVIALEELRPFLDTLSEEPDKNLEEAAEEKYPVYWKSYPKDGIVRSESSYDTNKQCRDAFIAGAEWQASQMPMPEDTVLFNKGVAEGRRLEREDMMKDAEKDLGWISVKDRLPEENKWVFVCVDMQGVPQCVGLGYLKDGEWCDDENDNGFCVDYWMDIPALPKEKEK